MKDKPIVVFEAQDYLERVTLCAALSALGYPVKVIEKEKPRRIFSHTDYYVYVYAKDLVLLK